MEWRLVAILFLPGAAAVLSLSKRYNACPLLPPTQVRVGNGWNEEWRRELEKVVVLEQLRKDIREVVNKWNTTFVDALSAFYDRTRFLCPITVGYDQTLAQGSVWCWSWDLVSGDYQHTLKGAGCPALDAFVDAPTNILDRTSAAFFLFQKIRKHGEYMSDTCVLGKGGVLLPDSDPIPWELDLRLYINDTRNDSSSLPLKFEVLLARNFNGNYTHSYFSAECGKDTGICAGRNSLASFAAREGADLLMDGAQDGWMIGNVAVVILPPAVLFVFLAILHAIPRDRLRNLGAIIPKLTDTLLLTRMPTEKSVQMRERLLRWAKMVKDGEGKGKPISLVFVEEFDIVAKELGRFPAITSDDLYFFNFWDWKNNLPLPPKEDRYKNMDLTNWLSAQKLYAAKLYRYRVEDKDPAYATIYGVNDIEKDAKKAKPSRERLAVSVQSSRESANDSTLPPSKRR